MTTENKKTHRTLNLFRKGLRLHDNEPLHHAISTSEVVFPVYIMGKYLINILYKNNLHIRHRMATRARKIWH